MTAWFDDRYECPKCGHWEHNSDPTCPVEGCNCGRNRLMPKLDGRLPTYPEGTCPGCGHKPHAGHNGACLVVGCPCFARAAAPGVTVATQQNGDPYRTLPEGFETPESNGPRCVWNNHRFRLVILPPELPRTSRHVAPLPKLVLEENQKDSMGRESWRPVALPPLDGVTKDLPLGLQQHAKLAEVIRKLVALHCNNEKAVR